MANNNGNVANQQMTAQSFGLANRLAREGLAAAVEADQTHKRVWEFLHANQNSTATAVAQHFKVSVPEAAAVLHDMQAKRLLWRELVAGVWGYQTRRADASYEEALVPREARIAVARALERGAPADSLAARLVTRDGNVRVDPKVLALAAAKGGSAAPAAAAVVGPVKDAAAVRAELESCIARAMSAPDGPESI